MSFQPVDPTLFFTRQDPQDPRFGDLALASITNPPKTGVHIFGWPDDEGIRMNGGRTGAKDAPDRIRRYLYKMTPSLSSPKNPKFFDRGNLATSMELSERHQIARQNIKESLLQGFDVLCLGGGHDYGFPDAAGFLDAFTGGKLRPAVINFDAHLDVRPADHGFHSGTPFRRLLEEFGDGFDFLEVGLQPQCNSRAHRDWAVQKGAELWMADELRTPGAAEARVSEWTSRRQGHPVFLSLDIDAITSRSAPGCSQSWDRGLTSDSVFSMIELFHRHLSVHGLGIYEVSPPLDQDDRTSKLAALFAFDHLTRRAGN
jgi:formiminoglutamase